MNAARLRPQTATQSYGEGLLWLYIAVIIAFALARDFTGAHVIRQLASSPEGILHGRWWQLFTSGLVAEGPWIPQVIALGVLGSVGIAIRGSWLFWQTAIMGHLFGTLVTYTGVWVAAALNPQWVHHLLLQPDYGISLIWCAALGILGAVAWLGPDGSRSSLHRPLLLGLVVAVMLVVTLLSDGLAIYEHIAAFIIAFGITALTPRHRHISKHLSTRSARRA